MNASPEEYFPFVRAMIWYLIMGFLYLSGMAIYVYRIPECIWPKKFDIWVTQNSQKPSQLTILIGLVVICLF